MRILLVVAPYYYPHNHAMRTELLGLTYIAASLLQSGHTVEIFDPTIEQPKKVHDGTYYYGVTEEEIEKRISRYSPDLVGVSCHYAYSCKEAYKIARKVKEIDPQIITVLGGLFTSVYKGKALLECDELDYALVGESEFSVLELLSALSSKPPHLEKVDGLLYRKDNKIAENEKKNFINDLDHLAFPARYLVDINRYMNTKTCLYGLGTRPTLALLTSRSCPYRCSFCNMWMVHGSRERFRSPENVLMEIDEIVNKYKAKNVFIIDDNFTFDPDRVKGICDGIIKKNYRFRWNTPNGISAKKIDAELAHLMKRAGCANVCIAIESGSEYIRNKVMKKNVSNEEIIKAVQYFNSAKIPVGGFIIIGMPGETEVCFKETIKFVKSLPLSFIAVTFAIPFPGTRLYDDLVKDGIISKDFLPKFDNFNFPLFSTKDFTESVLLKRRKELFLQFYMYNIKQIVSELFTGRLNWISPGMLKRVFVEKFTG